MPDYEMLAPRKFSAGLKDELHRIMKLKGELRESLEVITCLDEHERFVIMQVEYAVADSVFLIERACKDLDHAQERLSPITKRLSVGLIF